MAFNMNMAKAFIGKNVNLILKDGSVIINVQLSEVNAGNSNGQAFVKCIPYGEREAFEISLKKIAWIKPLDSFLIQMFVECS